jgi:hypothetical protein
MFDYFAIIFIIDFAIIIDISLMFFRQVFMLLYRHISAAADIFAFVIPISRVFIISLRLMPFRLSLQLLS